MTQPQDTESTENNTEDNAEENNQQQAPNLLQVIGSVLAGFFGVQSSKNKERDFKHGNHRVFIIVGIMMTLMFLLAVFTVVQIVLS